MMLTVVCVCVCCLLYCVMLVTICVSCTVSEVYCTVSRTVSDVYCSVTDVYCTMCTVLFVILNGLCVPQDRLEHLRKQCGPHVTAVAKDSVEGICSKIYHISAEYSRRLKTAHTTLMKECNLSGRSTRVGPSFGFSYRPVMVALDRRYTK